MNNPYASWQLIHEARAFADANAGEDDWQDVCDVYIEEHANNPHEAEASIEANNVALFSAAGVI